MEGGPGGRMSSAIPRSLKESGFECGPFCGFGWWEVRQHEPVVYIFSTQNEKRSLALGEGRGSDTKSPSQRKSGHGHLSEQDRDFSKESW